MNKTAIVIILISAASAFGAVKITDSGVVFSLDAPDAKKVYLAGDFNDWSTDADPLKESDVSGFWEITLKLKPGTYEYKFIVDGNWVIDPDNPETSPDPYGGENSIITVTGEISVPKDGDKAQITPSGGTSKGGVTFEYYNPSARTVFIAGDFNSWSPTANPMRSDGEGNWSAVIELPPGEYQYKFVVDGSWQPDPENPRTKPDGYGGINSVAVIDKNGNFVELKGEGIIERVSNTFVNSRVYIGGKYTGIAESRWNRENDRRFRLDKPRHRMETYIRVKINKDVMAWGSINLDTRDADRIYETPLSLDSAAVELKTDNVLAQVFYNRPVGGLDDPLDIIAPSAIAGAPDLEIPFGLGTGGIKVEGEIFETSFFGLFCDRFESYATEPPGGNLLDDLGRPRYGPFTEELITPSPDPDAYTEFGTDILGLRVSRPLGPVSVAGLFRYDTGTFWDALSNLEISSLDEWIDSTGSESDWFALGNSECLYGADISGNFDALAIWAECLAYSYSGGVVAGNRENDALDGNGPVDIKLGNLAGHLAGAGLTVKPSHKLMFQIGYHSQNIYSPEDSGFYIQPAPSTDGDGRVDIDLINITPDMGVTWWEAFSAKATVDWPISLWAKGGIEKFRNRFSETSRNAMSFGAGARGSLLWRFIGYDIYSNWATAKYADNSRSSEMLAKFGMRLHIAENWFFLIDMAYHNCYCENSTDSVLYDETSLPVFTSIRYEPVENVRLELYWGVHTEMANGWRAGRREFVDNYMREQGASFTGAWRALEDVRQIGLRAEIDF